MNAIPPEILPENVRRYLGEVLDVSDQRIGFVWSAPSFRAYIWRSYNSRTETHMAERMIHKAGMRGIHFDPDFVPRIDHERVDLASPLNPSPVLPEVGHMHSYDHASGFIQVEGEGIPQMSDLEFPSRIQERLRQSSAQASTSFRQGLLNDLSFHEGPVGIIRGGREPQGHAPNRRHHASLRITTQGMNSLQKSCVDIGTYCYPGDSFSWLAGDRTENGPEPSSATTLLLEGVLRERPHMDLTGKVFCTKEATASALGGFADVYRGTYNDGHKLLDVAIKRLRLNVRSREEIEKDFARELRIWSELDHPNVLPLLGYIKSGYPVFVSEWMRDGSLGDCLKSLGRMEALSMALGIAKGLAYLHSRGIIHSDLKSHNVLVSPEKQALLTDFGISRMESLSNGYGTKTLKGSARWQAKELFQIFEGTPPEQSILKQPVVIPTHTIATDIWAFGMTIYELLSYDRPYTAYKGESQVINAITKGRLPRWPKEFDNNTGCDRFIEDKLWAICGVCWNFVPDKRPRMTNIVKDLEDIKRKVTVENREDSD